MSGHSKFANIKHKKGKTDEQRGKLFTKLGREIAVAVKNGGPDPVANSRLADIVAKAKSNNMPMDSITRSIKKAAGDTDGAMYEEVTYEGYGPGGIAVIVESTTDNRNRTAADVRHDFDKYGGNLGTTGCVSFMFEKKGVIIVEKSAGVSEDDVMMEAIEAGAEDFTAEAEYYEITTSPADFSEIRAALEKKHTLLEADIEMIPSTYVKLTDPKHAELMEKMIEHLEDLDDVQNVYHNWEQPEAKE